MEQTVKELIKDVMIVNEFGLHARAAAQIASLAQLAGSNVWIVKGGQRVDASSVIDILTLACAKGADISIKVDDESDLGVLNDICVLVENGFGE